MRQRKVVSKKLFSKIRSLSSELLENHLNENIMRKIIEEMFSLEKDFSIL